MWWRDLLFIHYPYAPEVVQALLPDDLTIDTWPDADGIQRAWVALVPFEMVVGTPGGLRLPLIGTFPETNVRTYVRGPDGTPGVWFCSLEAGGLLASLTARAAYGLPYFWADMSIDPGRRATDGVWSALASVLLHAHLRPCAHLTAASTRILRRASTLKAVWSCEVQALFVPPSTVVVMST